LSKLDEISGFINQLSFDLKAEILGAILASQRMNYDQLLGSFDGQLKRVWSRDIAGTSVENLNTGDEMLCLHLNRDGIYDTLPEGLFHEISRKDSQSGEEMAKDSKQLKKEETEIRTFFQPFENELFIQGMRLASKENKLIKSIVSEYITGIIPHFWRVEDDLPERLVVSLKKILPLANRIAGNFNLTTRSLEFILKERVNFSLVNTPYHDTETYDFNETGVLGECFLGIDSIAGDRVNGFIGRVVFTIGPIMNEETAILVKNGRMNRFLDCFYGYFMPFEIDVETKYLFNVEESIFVLEDELETKISYLGYNSSIQ